MRSFADAPERARTAVRKAIKRAIDEIAAANPAIGEHLAQRVETGSTCCYHLATARSAGSCVPVTVRAARKRPRRPRSRG